MRSTVSAVRRRLLPYAAITSALLWVAVGYAFVTDGQRRSMRHAYPVLDVELAFFGSDRHRVLSSTRGLTLRTYPGSYGLWLNGRDLLHVPYILVLPGLSVLPAWWVYVLVRGRRSRRSGGFPVVEVGEKRGERGGTN
jgi:hypothetical protein